MPTATIEVLVQPKASRNRIVTQDGKVKVYVTAAPERGRANKAVVEALARNLDIPKGAVSIISGEGRGRSCSQLRASVKWRSGAG